MSRVTFVLQTALPVSLALSLAVALQAFVLQQSLLPLQLPQTRLQVLSAAHLKINHKRLCLTSPAGMVSCYCDSIIHFMRNYPQNPNGLQHKFNHNRHFNVAVRIQQALQLNLPGYETLVFNRKVDKCG